MLPPAQASELMERWKTHKPLMALPPGSIRRDGLRAPLAGDESGVFIAVPIFLANSANYIRVYSQVSETVPLDQLRPEPQNRITSRNKMSGTLVSPTSMHGALKSAVLCAPGFAVGASAQTASEKELPRVGMIHGVSGRATLR